MGVYIKGLQMPKSCSTCQMLEGDPADGICHAAGRWLDDDEYWTWYVYPEGDIDDSRPSNCPLIELSDHGDLIDREALMPKSEGKGLRLMAIGIENIVNAPTVIPAERSENATD